MLYEEQVKMNNKELLLKDKELNLKENVVQA